MRARTILSGVGGIIVGALVAFVLGGVLINVQWGGMLTTVNGWKITMACGEPGNNILVQAACAEHLAAVNLPQESVYWTAGQDGAGQRLTGQHDYILKFPPGGLPPNNAFWSVTMYSTTFRFVNNSINRYEVSDRSGLVPNADGSIDIYIQNAPPAGHESNWLPAPTGRFILFLRVYLPGQTILNGSYTVPPVTEVR